MAKGIRLVIPDADFSQNYVNREKTAPTTYTECSVSPNAASSYLSANQYMLRCYDGSTTTQVIGATSSGFYYKNSEGTSARCTDSDVASKIFKIGNLYYKATGVLNITPEYGLSEISHSSCSAYNVADGVASVVEGSNFYGWKVSLQSGKTYVAFGVSASTLTFAHIKKTDGSVIDISGNQKKATIYYIKYTATENCELIMSMTTGTATGQVTPFVAEVD